MSDDLCSICGAYWQCDCLPRTASGAEEYISDIWAESHDDTPLAGPSYDDLLAQQAQLRRAFIQEALVDAQADDDGILIEEAADLPEDVRARLQELAKKKSIRWLGTLDV